MIISLSLIIFSLNLCLQCHNCKEKFYPSHLGLYDYRLTNRAICQQQSIDHLHYDVIHAKPDGSCSRPAKTGPSVLLKLRESQRVV